MRAVFRCLSGPLSWVVIALLCGAVISASRQDQTGAPSKGRLHAKPLDPVAAILDAFRSHRVVALGEGSHGNLPGHALRLALIRDQRFAGTVNDIVVEFGNSLYQDVMDEFVSGAVVPPERLRSVWQNTTQPFATFDVPIYEEFFRAVRAVNAALPQQRRLRVILGEPPIDWDDIRTQDEAYSWLAGRDSHPAESIRREVIAKGRRALVIYGTYHLLRKRPKEKPWRTIVNWLEDATAPVTVFTVATSTYTDPGALQPSISGWRKPSLTLLQGNVLGSADFSAFFPMEKEPWSIRMEEQFDALLYVGRPSEISHATLGPELCADPAYRKMRTQRLALTGFGGDPCEKP